MNGLGRGSRPPPTNSRPAHAGRREPRDGPWASSSSLGRPRRASLPGVSHSGPRWITAPRAASAVRYTRPVEGPGAPVLRGWFITVEGPDGAGKTTQAEALSAHLEARGLNVLLTREPGGTWLGEQIREVLLARTGSTRSTDPLTDAFLFNAARRQLVAEVVRPALAVGRTVLCARFADSTLAYQGYGAGVPLDRLRALAAVATDGLTPDLTILLDLPVEAGLARRVVG